MYILKPCPFTNFGIIAHMLLLIAHVLPLTAHYSLLITHVLVSLNVELYQDEIFKAYH